MDSANQKHRGRGAISNAVGRFEGYEREGFDDGWGNLDEEEEPSPRTILTEDKTRTIIARNSSPDIPFDRSINPYRGCEHGCIYCFARPTHAYLNLSPGLDFETRILVKPRAAALLRAELGARSYRPAVLALGTNTDPYQPTEKRLGITRSILEVLQEFRHPVCIVTKSALVTRDIDILAPMAAARLAKVALSVTSLDGELARRMEPRASTPARRLAAIRTLTAAGIPTSILTAPLIPALNDDELERLLEAGRDAGARSAGYVLLRLPLEIDQLFQEWLATHAPLKAKHVMSLVRQTRGGKSYDSSWSQRMVGTGPYAALIRARFTKAVKRLGLATRDESWRLDTTLFRVPPKPGDQLSFL